MSQSVSEVFRDGACYLKSRGVPDAQVSAGELLAHVLKKSRPVLYTEWDAPVESKGKDAFFRLIRKRSGHYPLQYLTGRVPFRYAEFRVAEGTFIPRPETECLVDLVSERLAERKNHCGARILDVGTGSGCIAVSLALEIPNAQIVATDRSLRSLRLAEKNAAENGVADKVTLTRTHYWKGVNGLFDALVSNPPYLTKKDFVGLQKEVRFEPRLALNGGEDGKRSYRYIARHAREILKPGGLLALEVGMGQAEEVTGLLTRFGFSDIRKTRDLAGIERIVSGILD